jgi:hypothetical protein
VLVRDDDVYVFQPRKGGSVKSSYHQSGQQHLKVGKGAPIMDPMQLDPPSQVLTEENPWSKSFENFANLLPYEGEKADALFEIDLPTTVETLPFAQISIGRSFDSKGWTVGTVSLVTLRQEVFSVPHSANGLQVCVRVVRLQQPA